MRTKNFPNTDTFYVVYIDQIPFLGFQIATFIFMVLSVILYFFGTIMAFYKAIKKQKAARPSDIMLVLCYSIIGKSTM